jgi:hypothetical protein
MELEADRHFACLCCFSETNWEVTMNRLCKLLSACIVFGLLLVVPVARADDDQGKKPKSKAADSQNQRGQNDDAKTAKRKPVITQNQQGQNDDDAKAAKRKTKPADSQNQQGQNDDDAKTAKRKTNPADSQNQQGQNDDDAKAAKRKTKAEGKKAKGKSPAGGEGFQGEQAGQHEDKVAGKSKAKTASKQGQQNRDDGKGTSKARTQPGGSGPGRAVDLDARLEQLIRELEALRREIRARK